MPADSKSPYGYIVFNGVKYPIVVGKYICEYEEKDKISYITGESTRIIVVEMTQEDKEFDLSGFSAGFIMSEEYGSLLGEVLQQVLDHTHYKYRNLCISQEKDGSDGYAIIRVGSSEYVFVI